MKFLNPKTGDIYDVQDSCVESGFCKHIPWCSECPIHNVNRERDETCADWVNQNAERAAAMMGYLMYEEDSTRKNPTRAIAIDFDGTLFKTQWPEILEPNRHVIDQALDAQRNGAQLILWTCREGKLLEDALAACEKEGLHFDAVNDSTESWKRIWGTSPRKVGATEYWDDRAVNPREWETKTADPETDSPTYVAEYEGSGETEPDPNSRRGILLQAIRCVCGDRDQDYGSPEHSLSAIGRFWADYIRSKYGAEVPLTGADASAMMVLFKMARVATGHGKADNWIDAAGYAACGGELEVGCKATAQKHA